VDHLLAPVNTFAERPQRPAHDDVQAASFVSGDEENFVARQAAFDRPFGQRAKLRLFEFAEKLRLFQRGDSIDNVEKPLYTPLVIKTLLPTEEL
jgi:hypothetical protein